MDRSTVEYAHITTMPDTRRGAPRIEGTRIAVAEVVLMHLRMGHALAEIAGRFELPMAAVHSAMAYYYDHRQAIDRRIEEDEALSESLRERLTSPLSEKLALQA